LYIPLGGSRHGPARTYAALLLTMALGGLWHGAAWNFVIWGALHGVLLCLYRLAPLERRWRLGSAVLFQLCVVLLWVPFRCRTVGQTTAIWQAMLGGTPLGPLSDLVRLGGAVVVFYIFHALEEQLTGDGPRAALWWRRWLRIPPEARGVAAAAILIADVLLLLTGTTFIYFRF
jgi:alginate O-acetyltransferase complex protein AlgI